MYEQQQLGFNYRITDIQAALGLSQLQRLEEIVAERNRQVFVGLSEGQQQRVADAIRQNVTILCARGANQCQRSACFTAYL